MTDSAPFPTPVWLVSNATSGSHRAEVVEAVMARFAEAGRPVARHIRLGEDDLPTADAARAAGVGLVILHGGDGTITSATDRLAGWDGEILVLPGGTMNLLARALHGERDAVEIADRAAAGALPAVRVPIISGGGHCALAGVIAGPTSAWGDVREHLRQGAIRELATSIGEALTETLSGDDIRVAGEDGVYQAVYLQPDAQGIRVRGVLARNAGELLRHGWAWLAGDFRDGPNVELGIRPEVRLDGRSAIGLLIDGERAEAGSRLDFHRAESAHRYLSCNGRAIWS